MMQVLRVCWAIILPALVITWHANLVEVEVIKEETSLAESTRKNNSLSALHFPRNASSWSNDALPLTKAPLDPANENINDDDDDDDPQQQALLQLIRPRPRNLHLVFVGDSLTRFQYLSLAYFLRHGRWWDHHLPVDMPNNLMAAHSFHHPHHPADDWNEFFLQSNRLLQPYELCDCIRNSSNNRTAYVMERRYFQDASRNNTLVYIHMNGHVTYGSWGYYGRVNPQQVFAANNGRNFTHGMVVANNNTGSTFNNENDQNNNQTNTDDSLMRWWEYETWGEVLQHHVGALDMGATAASPVVVVLNAGIHRHHFDRTTTAAQNLVDALKTIPQAQGVWRTTTYTQAQVLAHHRHGPPAVRASDQFMCDQFQPLYGATPVGGCFNISWTAFLRPELYIDQYHFHEPVYRILNEELLQHLGVLPARYRRLNRSVVLQDNSNSDYL